MFARSADATADRALFPPRPACRRRGVGLHRL